MSWVGLETVGGNVTVSSTSQETAICDDFKKLKSKNVIKGSLSCEPSSGPSGTDSITTVQNNNANKDNIKAVVQAGIAVGAVVGVIIVSLVAFYWIRSIKRTRATTRSVHQEDTNSAHEVASKERQPAQLPLGGHHEKGELYVDPKAVAELHNQSLIPDGNVSRPRIVVGVHELHSAEPDAQKLSSVH